ncbi:thioesterase II family protein [Streptomyces sp. NPDC059063]|uniref:thioesterase II family protein n=1 Tax=unclassified Streptomyces TaxID=2593676 RepID=UPI0036CD6D3A
MQRIPVICLPFAGAGASFFRPWREQASERLLIVPVQLPGREERLDEEPYADVGEAVDDLVPEVLDVAERYPRFVVFGHSLGAVLAYEVTRQLAETLPPGSLHLVVSGSPAPHEPRTRRATGLPDEEFLRQVRDFAGYDHPALADPGARDLILPVLRADVAMHENYRPAPGRAPLPLPVTSVIGASDHLVSREQADRWQSVTAQPLRKAEVDGGHMYLTESPKDLLSLLDASAGDALGDVRSPRP